MWTVSMKDNKCTYVRVGSTHSGQNPAELTTIPHFIKSTKKYSFYIFFWAKWHGFWKHELLKHGETKEVVWNKFEYIAYLSWSPPFKKISLVFNDYIGTETIFKNLKKMSLKMIIKIESWIVNAKRNNF